MRKLLEAHLGSPEIDAKVPVFKAQFFISVNPRKKNQNGSLIIAHTDIVQNANFI